MCNQASKDLLVSYLYDDINDMDRAKVDMHLRACDECRTELNALRGVRVDLGSWAPPLPDLGFRMVRDAKHLAKEDAKQFVKPAPSWRSWLTPAAGLAAAATLVFAAALSLAHIEIHNGPDGFTARTGWSAAAPAEFAGGYGGARSVSAHDVILPSDEGVDLAGIVQRIDALETALHDAPQVRNAVAMNTRASDEELIKRVRDMLAQSESRQQGELALRIGQVIRDFDNVRRADLATIQAVSARVDNNMTKEAQLHTDLVNYVNTTAGKQK